ncbi:TPA: type II secretion system protein GspG [bacterium]|nr:type II secretion system protein GspG [bacterium]
MFLKIRKSKEKGFTLIELMVVITILALLGGVVAPQVIGRLRQAKPKKAAMDIKAIELGLDMYMADNGNYPTTEQGLQALITQPTSPPEPMDWNGPYVKPTDFKDPWGVPYVYISPSNRQGYEYELYSLGSDGQEGGTGEAADITNWLQDESSK